MTTKVYRGPVPVNSEAPLKPAPAAAQRERNGGQAQSALRPASAKGKKADADDDYGDDFEDYDEDFEEFEDEKDEISVARERDFAPPIVARPMEGAAALPSGISAVKKAVDEENNRASNRQQKGFGPAQAAAPTADSHFQASALPNRKLTLSMNPSGPRMSAQTKRAKELQALIEFDVAIYPDIFDLPPMNEYDLYIRSYGAQNTKQAAVQLNEDNVDVEVQTDDWTVEDKWSQCPPDQLVESGTGKPELPWMKSERDGWAKADKRRELLKQRGGSAVGAMDSASLLKFMRSAGVVMDAVIEENSRGQGSESKLSSDGRSQIPMCSGLSVLQLPGFLSGRVVTTMAFSPSDHRLILIGWGHPKAPFNQSKLGKLAIVTMWRLADPKTPWRVLVCEGVLTSCMTCPTKPHLIFAGTTSGSVNVWDLNEPGNLHKGLGVDGFVIRRPSYSTDGLYFDDGSGHQEPICNVICLIRTEEEIAERKSNPATMEGRVGESFQIATIDERGFMQIWVVTESRDHTYANVNESDFGMAIGSQVALVKSTGFLMRNPQRNIMWGCELTTKDCKLKPGSVDEFVVATHTGQVLHESRFREVLHPRSYDHFKDNPGLVTDPVTSLDFNAHLHDTFLAGFRSGRVALFRMDSSLPKMYWELDAAVKQIRWSPHRPSVFYVLDEHGSLYLWDLLEKGSAYSKAVQFGKRKPVRFELSPGAVALTGSNITGGERSGVIVVAFEDGDVESHSLTEEWTRCM
ncbi:WD repeat-containing protein 60 [Irineochytrium annulatum]|nr:WD repeat-containing protein 60 [Irineochytrium annulatum]